MSQWIWFLFIFVYIGARQPSYVVTADDVDTLLAIEVQPLDDRKRKVLIVMWLIFLFREYAGEVQIFVLIG